MHNYITFQMVASETSPPSLLTEADLIALMDKHGIGRFGYYMNKNIIIMKCLFPNDIF